MLLRHLLRSPCICSEGVDSEYPYLSRNEWRWGQGSPSQVTVGWDLTETNQWLITLSQWTIGQQALLWLLLRFKIQEESKLSSGFQRVILRLLKFSLWNYWFIYGPAPLQSFRTSNEGISRRIVWVNSYSCPPLAVKVLSPLRDLRTSAVTKCRFNLTIQISFSYYYDHRLEFYTSIHLGIARCVLTPCYWVF